MFDAWRIDLSVDFVILEVLFNVFLALIYFLLPVLHIHVLNMTTFTDRGSFNWVAPLSFIGNLRRCKSGCVEVSLMT